MVGAKARTVLSEGRDTPSVNQARNALRAPVALSSDSRLSNTSNVQRGDRNEGVRQGGFYRVKSEECALRECARDSRCPAVPTREEKTPEPLVSMEQGFVALPTRDTFGEPRFLSNFAPSPVSRFFVLDTNELCVLSHQDAPPLGQGATSRLQ